MDTNKDKNKNIVKFKIVRPKSVLILKLIINYLIILIKN